MHFKTHSELEGLHSFLSPSNYHWLNYTPEKLVSVYKHQKQKEEGTVLHNFAAMAIQKRIKLAKIKRALNMFVNDAIGFKMTPEQVLYYSHNSFGTADAISFRENLLRIHDLKTGISKPSFKQLHIYAALFCLEYDINPEDIFMELRLYQGTGYEVDIPDGAYIRDVMNIIVEFDGVLEDYKKTI